MALKAIINARRQGRARKTMYRKAATASNAATSSTAATTSSAATTPNGTATASDAMTPNASTTGIAAATPAATTTSSVSTSPSTITTSSAAIVLKTTWIGVPILAARDNQWPNNGGPAPVLDRVVHTIHAVVAIDQNGGEFDMRPTEAITPYHAALLEQALPKPLEDVPTADAADDAAAEASDTTVPTTETVTAAGSATTTADSPQASIDGEQPSEPQRAATPKERRVGRKRGVYGSNLTALKNTPAKNAQLPRNITAEEILIFFPQSRHRNEIMHHLLQSYGPTQMARIMNAARGTPNSLKGPVAERSGLAHKKQVVVKMASFEPFKLPHNQAVDVTLSEILAGVRRLPTGRGRGRLTRLLECSEAIDVNPPLSALMDLIEGKGKIDDTSVRKALGRDGL